MSQQYKVLVVDDDLKLRSLLERYLTEQIFKKPVFVTDYPKGEQRPHKFKMAMAIFAITILIALTSKLPVALTLMTGVAGMLVTGVLRMDEAYQAISWKTVFLMAGLIPLGWAMDSSGTAAWVAGHTVERLPEGIPGPTAGWIVMAGGAAVHRAVGNEVDTKRTPRPCSPSRRDAGHAL